MGLVVFVVRIGLAVGAEVCVVANSALVTHALDVAVLVLAERAITVDTNVLRLVRVASGSWDGFVMGCESMMRVIELGVLDTFRAVIPIRAVHALVADTEDWLITAIAQSGVLDTASRSTHERAHSADCAFCNSLEGMSWMMTMLIGLVASSAEIKVVAVNASNKLILGVFYCMLAIVW